MAEGKRFKLSFEFVRPAEGLLDFARELVNSPNENCRSVAKAVLDVTSVGREIEDALSHNRDADLAPYFDFWFADSINCARQLLHGEDQEARGLAECLIMLEQAAIKSKENFLSEAKRLGMKRMGD